MAATARDVLAGTASWSAEAGDCLDLLPTLPERCVSLVFFSPPYEKQRTYGLDVVRSGQAWVDWMRRVVVASCRVSAGLVVVNAAGPVENFRYSPTLECLVADLTRLDGVVCGPAPYAWVKSQNREDADGNGTPGSGGRHYQRRDWESLYAFALPDRLPLAWSDNTAFGHAPRYGAGGAFSARCQDGTRANDPWKTASRGGGGVGGREPDGSKKAGTLARSPGSSRRANGERKRVKRMKGPGHEGGTDREEQEYVPAAISNPGNLIRCPVGGGKLGHPLAHESEAPMTVSVCERFVCWFVPPEGIILDCFVGSGTSIHAAINHGRRAIGFDLRPCQVALTERRMATVTPGMFS